QRSMMARLQPAAPDVLVEVRVHPHGRERCERHARAVRLHPGKLREDGAAALPRPVLDDDGLAERRPESLREQPRYQVGRLARRKPDENPGGLTALRLGKGGDAAEKREEEKPFHSDDSGRTQTYDVARSQSERAVDFVVVLAERGASAAHAARRFGKSRHHALHADVAEFRIGHAHNRLARGELRVGKDVGCVVDRREADFMTVETFAQLGKGSLPDLGAHNLIEGIAVFHARWIVGEGRVGEPRLQSERGAQAHKDALGGRGDRGPLAIFGAIDVARRRVLAAIAGTDANGPELVALNQEKIQSAQHRFRYGAIDLLSARLRIFLQPIERREDTHRPDQPADGIGDGISAMQRWATLLAAHAGEAAHRLEHAGEAGAVATGPRLPKAGDAQYGEPRVDVLKPGARDAPIVERAGAEVLDQDIAACDQLAKQGLAFGLAPIERDAFLVAVCD